MLARMAWRAAWSLVVAVYLAHVWWLAGMADDAFISFRYASHVAFGAGWVWNVGEAPVEGYTNFLWVLLHALYAKLGFDLPRAAQLTGAVAGLVTLVYVDFAARRLGWKRRWALLPVALLAICGPFAAWAAAGLETVVFTSLVTAALVHAAGWAREGDDSDCVALFVVLLLAALLRPEGLLVAAVILPVSAPFALRDQRGRLLVGCAVLAVLYGAYFVWRWQHFGYLLPNTFYAKTGGGWAQATRGAEYVGYFLLHFAAPWAPALLLAIGSARVWPRFGGVEPLTVLAATLCVVWALYVAAVGGDYMAMYRFLVPVLPALALLLGGVLRMLLRSSRHGGTALRAAAVASVVLGVLGTGLHSTPFEARVFDVPPRMHGNHRGVETERWHVARLGAIGEAFAAHAGGANASIATDAIGAIGWFSGLRVYGAHGLVDPQIAHQAAAAHAVGSDFAGHDRRDLWRLFEREPTYFMFTRELRPTRPSGIEVPDAYADVVAADYRLATLWIEDSANGEAGWLPFLERRAEPDAPTGAPGERGLNTQRGVSEPGRSR